MKQKKLQKSYWEMTADELAEATKEFDKPIPLSKTRPLTKRERAEFERMRRSPHRSVFVTRGADGTFIRLDTPLMHWCMRYAAEHKMTFSELVAKSLQGMMAMVE